MNIDVIELLDEIIKARGETIKAKAQVVVLTNAIRSCLHHPRSGEKLRMMRKCLDCVEANFP